MYFIFILFFFFFFNDTATTEIYTLSLHDALPIFEHVHANKGTGGKSRIGRGDARHGTWKAHLDVIALRSVRDRKSTRLNSSHSQISYAVFCLKKKKTDIV